jgi:4-hydroxybenzoate polyprenyltransferase
MAAATTYLRTLLVLGRVSNVPTVWSNCLAGWLLAGGGDWGYFLLMTFAATCLYVGGMYLNDAFDATFDLQHRPERPIPSGAIRVEAVWAWGFGWLGLGLACVLGFDQTTIIFALLLVVTILVYDAIHKMFALSPLLMAACRFFLVLLAASAGRDGITGLSIWTALALAAYIIGLSFLARKESVAAPVNRWPCVFLAIPLMLALVVNQGEYLLRAIVLCVLVGIWMLRCLSFALWSPQRNIGRCVSGLLAGIALVDLLAAWNGSPWIGSTFVALFALALLFQRFVPAT